jgi:hypothetical protein
MQGGTAAAQAAIFRRHVTTFSVKETAHRIEFAFDKAQPFDSVVACAGRGILPLLRELRTYCRDVPLDAKPRAGLDLVLATQGPGGAPAVDPKSVQQLRCWSAVLPWETSYGLSRCPAELLSRAGSVTEQPSGMLFVMPAPERSRSHFWSGAITGPLDVAFAHAVRGVQRSLLPKPPTTERSLRGGASGSFRGARVGNIARLDTLDRATRGSHAVSSTYGQVSAVLETQEGMLRELGVAAVSETADLLLLPSPELMAEIDDKWRLGNAFAGPLMEAVSMLVGAVARRGGLPGFAGVATHDEDVELVLLAHQLGMGGPQLFEVLSGRLADDMRRTVIAAGAAGADVPGDEAQPARGTPAPQHHRGAHDGDADDTVEEDGEEMPMAGDLAPLPSRLLSPLGKAAVEELLRDRSVQVPIDLRLAAAGQARMD